MIIQPVRDALDYYRRLNEASQPPRHRKSTDVTAMQSVNPSVSFQQHQAVENILSDNRPSDVTDNATKAEEEKTSKLSSPSTATAPSVTATLPQPDTQDSETAESPIVASELPPLPTVIPMAPRNSNPLSYRRASQLLMLKASGSSNSLKVSSLQPLRPAGSGNTNASNFQSFPSVESESDKEDDGCGPSEDEAITEVAVSEKALKFKITTEPSFDFTASRKGSRENKSESSGQSTVATKDDRISFDTSYASTPKKEFAATLLGSSSSPGKHISSKPTSSASASTSAKAKPKDSFFSRLKLFTERLSISADSTASTGSGCGSESPPMSAVKQHGGPGFNYFRRGGRKDSRKGKSKDEDYRYHHQVKHRGSSSDPEGHISDDKPVCDIGKENLQLGGSQIASPDCSPALSGASGIEQRRSSWKHCSGSLDSVLSKDDNAKRSPSRRLMLPRFSSFVQKKTRMGFMRRSSPKGPNPNPSDPQS